MRYIGSKEKVLPFIEEVILNSVGEVEGAKFGDLFSGTTCVAQHFKKLGVKLITNDYMSFSYAFQIAYIKNNSIPQFSKLKSQNNYNDYKEILGYLNNLNGVEGFFYREYTKEGTKKGKYQRNYFSEENGKKIDAIRIAIGNWYNKGLITKDEFYILLASLVDGVTKVSNISGTYGAFLKFDEQRKNKCLMLEPIKEINSKYAHCCYCEDIFNLIECVNGDILYLDPPYNSRQYPPYYHILETVTLYDEPAIYGRTGRRPYQDKLSPFCIKREAGDAIKTVIDKAKFEHIFLSYSTDGLLSKKEIFELLSSIGYVKVFEEKYRRYKSNSNGDRKKTLKEIIFYVRK